MRIDFDSCDQPRAVSPRASKLQRSRQIIHESEPYVVDLRIQVDPVSQRFHVTGQVLNYGNPEREVGAIEVLVLGRGRIVARTSAASSGEFSLAFDPERDLRLFINIQEHRAIVIELMS
jgi:hypothetical protein